MAHKIQYEKLGARINTIFQEHGEQSALPMENYLTEELSLLDAPDKLKVLEKLIKGFESGKPHTVHSSSIAIDDHVLARVIKLLLGRDISPTDYTSDELLESLANSINTVFEALNQLISVINTTLVGKQDSDQTIRQVIGYHLEGSPDTKSLESYIGQIGKAFFQSQEASKKAAHTKVMEILEELSPERIKQEAGISKLSPLRKSRYYEVYEEKFEKFETWFESGRFMESFLREFEKNCQKISF
jgi:type VI secretion system (T6SS) FHA protein